jgi:hypothetical protein
MNSSSFGTTPVNAGDKQTTSPNEPSSTVRLSADLVVLRQRLEGRSLSIGELEQALKGRGFAMLLLFLALPFCFVPIPGLSTPFGLAVSLIGIRIAARRKPWLPAFVLRKRLSATRLARLLHGTIRFVRLLERVVRPRMEFLHRWPGILNLIGLSIAAGGLLLLLPLPIPFSNTIPAWAVVLLTAGMMERDGLLVLAGYTLTLASWGLLIAIWSLGTTGVQQFSN